MLPHLAIANCLLRSYKFEWNRGRPPMDVISVALNWMRNVLDDISRLGVQNQRRIRMVGVPVCCIKENE